MSMRMRHQKHREMEKKKREIVKMEDLCFPILNENDVKQRSIFILNDNLQVVFITDLKTGKKLDDDYKVNEYLQAVVQANLLESHGISEPEQITAILRSEEVDTDITTVVITLDVVTNVQNGVDELRCSISEEGLYFETEEFISSNNSSSLWNQKVPELSESENSDFGNLPDGSVPSTALGPTLRWNSEMTRQLISIRGEMDCEFASAKYKFRLWELVAVKLNEVLANVKVTAKDCDDKWRNIVATYRKNIDKIKCCADNTIRWEYFNAMDDILKGTQELMTNELYQNSVSDETMAHLMHSLEPTEMDSTCDPFELISVSGDSSPIEELELEDLHETPQDCIITRKFNGDKRKWTTEQCLLLIHLRTKMDGKFQKSRDSLKTPILWTEIASQMNINFLSDFTAGELESVWNHCNISYEVNLENLKSRGVNTITWKYFAIMDQLRGGTKEIAELCVPRPGEYLLKEFCELSKKHPTLSPQSDISGFNGIEETDSEDVSTLCSSGVVWTQDMVKVLISLKKVIEQDIAKHKIPRKKQWWILVRRFRALNNAKVTEEACEEKWRNLVRTYKKNLTRVRKRGTSVIRWPYFWKMHEILRNSVADGNKHSADSVVNKSQLKETAEVPSITISTLPTSDQVVVGGHEETVPDHALKNLQTDEDLSNMISDLRDKQNRMLHELVDRQNKKIEELHREQIEIKTLLTQLLQKFP